MVELYVRKGCFFCRKVLAAIEKLGCREDVDYQVIDADPGTAGRQRVVEVGGKSMVPFLIDDETAMYESDDIIAYMQGKFR